MHHRNVKAIIRLTLLMSILTPRRVIGEKNIVACVHFGSRMVALGSANQ